MISPFSDCLNYFIRRLVGWATIAKQVGEASREGGLLALRQSEDFKARMSCGRFSPLQVVDFAFESPHDSIRVEVYHCLKFSAHLQSES